MDNLFKKLTEEVAGEIAKAVTSEGFTDLITKTKESDTSRAFEVVMSSSAIDRHGETILQSGWDFKNYMSNPVVLWGHDYQSLPVGIVTEIVPDGEKTVARGLFAPADANPLAEQLHKLYQAGMLRTVSVGFIPKEYNGNQITKAELLELSFVSVPANPEALVTGKMKDLGLDLELLTQKGVFTAEATAEVPAEKAIEPVAEVVVEKSGRVLSAKTRETMKIAIDGMEAGVAALKTLYDATEEQGSEGKQADVETAPELQRSNPSGVTDAQTNSFTEMLKGKSENEAEAFKEALKFLATATGEALHAMKNSPKTK